MFPVLVISLALSPAPPTDAWHSLRACLRKQIGVAGTVDVQMQRMSDDGRRQGPNEPNASLLDHIYGAGAASHAARCGGKPVEEIPAGCYTSRVGNPIKAYATGPNTYICDYDDENHIAAMWRFSDAGDVTLSQALKWARLPMCKHATLQPVGEWPVFELAHTRQQLTADTTPQKAMAQEVGRALKALPPPVDWVQRSSGWTWMSNPTGEEDPDKVERNQIATRVVCATGQKSRSAEPTVEDKIEEAVTTLLQPRANADGKAKADAFALLKANATIATERLLALLTDETPASLTNPNLLLALGRLGQPAAVEPLRRAMENSSDSTAQYAGQALGEHPSADAQKALLTALESEREPVVVAAVSGLALRKDKSTCTDLVIAQKRFPEAKSIREAVGKLRCPKTK